MIPKTMPIIARVGETTGTEMTSDVGAGVSKCKEAPLSAAEMSGTSNAFLTGQAPTKETKNISS
jgi:hypothetical protein